MRNFTIIAILAGTVILSVFPAYAQKITALRRASLSPTSNASGQNFAYDADIDGSGNLVVFTSLSDNFAAPGKVTGENHEHVYIRNIASGTTTQLDVTAEGRTGSPGTPTFSLQRNFDSSFDPHISRDGSTVVFISPASDISPDGENETFGSWIYIKNLPTGAIRRVPFSTAGNTAKAETPTYLTISGNGSVVAFTSIIGDISDTTGSSMKWELSVYDGSTTELINTGINGNKYNPEISDDGRYIVFENQEGDFSNPTYSYLYDRFSKTTTALNAGNPALDPTISGDGSYIAYTDISNFSYRIKLLQLATLTETLVSGGLNGEEPAGISAFPSLSYDGRYIAFLSSADNLVANDSNGVDDIFVFDRLSGMTTAVSVQAECPGLATSEEFNTGPPAISSDGKTITFNVTERLISSAIKDTSGSIIEPADQNGFDDVYVATIDFDALPQEFQKGVVPDAPFVTVNCLGSTARIQVREINKPIQSSKAKKAGQIKKVTQKLIIKKIVDKKSSNFKRLTAKRNVLTAGNLPPGNYSAQLQAEARLSNGGVKKSKLSPASNFTITD